MIDVIHQFNGDRDHFCCKKKNQFFTMSPTVSKSPTKNGAYASAFNGRVTSSM